MNFLYAYPLSENCHNVKNLIWSWSLNLCDEPLGAGNHKVNSQNKVSWINCSRMGGVVLVDVPMCCE